MRAPTQHSTTIARLFSTHRNSPSHAPKIQSFGSPGRSPSIKTLASAGRLRDAVRLLILRRHLGLPVHPDYFVAIIKPCASPGTLMEGRQLHAHMVISGFNQDPFICNHLINMYCKCGSLDDAHWVFRGVGKKKSHSWNILIAGFCRFGFLSEAQQLFDEMPKRVAASWNTMISGYDRWGPCEEALEIFVRMRRTDCNVDHFGLSSAISACSNLRFLGNGRGLHACSAKIGLDSHVQVGSALIGLYAKCVELKDARSVFDEMGARELFTWNSMLAGYVQCSKIDEALLFFKEMPERDVVSWTTVVAGLAQHERNEEAIGLFHKTREVGLMPDQISFVSVLNACVGVLDFEEGFKIHGQIMKSGFGTDVNVGSATAAFYAKCGCMNDAKRVTDGMPLVDDFSWSVLIAEYAKHGQIDSAHELFQSFEVRSIPLWNALIGGYSELGLHEKAFETFEEMQMDGKRGDEFTFGSLLMGVDLLGMKYGEQLHSQIIKIGIDFSVFVGSGLIDMYSSCLECEAAVRVFNSIRQPNLVSWNSMISGYGLNNLDKGAILTFRLMMALGVIPDNITLSLVLDSCSSLLALYEGTQFHALARKLGFDSDVVVGSALIDMYSKCENMDCAAQAFSDIHGHTVVSWTSLIGGYIRCGMWATAKKLFEIMPERNVVSWNTMLSGYAKYGFGLEALNLYHQMNKSGLLPDQVTFFTVLSVCSNFLLGENGKQVHAQIFKTGYHMNARVSSALTVMYQKLGKLADGVDLCSGFIDFKHGNVLDRTEPDAISGNN
ncbi:pentatricopeptide repeat-containing protein At4g20770-like [Phoenix dactylifera]|uniref:Pentatricopeptide repeat-containing protein At4g20770-like n=1 Tax=Phoenix dactylifera TaxID=42345 RepID=A0A8B7CHS9_PHODC|nr:pentatricopeptide repeat-containing protein At4g20770-like [Phoenix dactylifera]XP_026664011.2 pentatricopeptide repeat-containing protein At4g20770-like [Phoenix dactylifera]XP_038986187.1 pentatricopeptide repeat-containing protein At4g20770-like [Phoenix dactylifera]